VACEEMEQRLGGNGLDGFDEKIRERCEALIAVVQGVRPFYQQATEYNKAFIETTVGAALFYLPTRKSLWTGKISREAKERGEKSPDHPFPRKIAAAEILSMDWKNDTDPVNSLSKLYKEKYGVYNYVSKRENKALQQVQKKGLFTTPEEAYEQVGIELIEG
jgi:hypothetical protein